MERNFNCNATVDLPYPKIEPESRNREYALAMLSNVGSSNSEMTAVSLYFYNHVILEPSYAAFSKCFEEISIAEMHHLEMFATLSFEMGADPRLWSNRNGKMVYWTPEYNNYPREVRNVITNSIQSEQAAIRKYKAQAANIKDKNVVSILNRIILDEERHIEIFEEMLKLLNT